MFTSAMLAGFGIYGKTTQPLQTPNLILQIVAVMDYMNFPQPLGIAWGKMNPLPVIQKHQ